MEAFLHFVDTRDIVVLIFTVEQLTITLLKPVELLQGIVGTIFSLISESRIVLFLPLFHNLFSIRELNVKLVV
jgi:hypothetical protein